MPVNKASPAVFDIKPLPPEGFVRLSTVLAYIPVSRSSFYKGQIDGRYPKPVSLGARSKGYDVRAIKALIEQINRGEA